MFAWASALTIEPAGDCVLLPENDYPGLSGISWIGGSNYIVVQDGNSGGEYACLLQRLTAQFDAQGRLLGTPTLSKGIPLEKALDAEDIAYDPWSKCVWVATEPDVAIREHDLKTGKQTGREVKLPEFFRKAARFNFTLESLTISGDGRTLWTANEEALTTDGPASSPRKGTLIRLVKYTRTEASPEWKLAGMWAYRCSPSGLIRPVLSGVAALCVLPDGSLLVMERECSFGTLGRSRIYRPDFSQATDVSNMPSLADASFKPVVRGPLLYESTDGKADEGSLTNFSIVFYEGLCLGPRNKDGTLNLMLVADGGPSQRKNFKTFTVTVRTRAAVRALRLSGL